MEPKPMRSVVGEGIGATVKATLLDLPKRSGLSLRL
jgi:hypothetical protein